MNGNKIRLREGTERGWKWLFVINLIRLILGGLTLTIFLYFLYLLITDYENFRAILDRYRSLLNGLILIDSLIAYTYIIAKKEHS